MQFDPRGVYSASDMQALNETFADLPAQTDAAEEKPKEKVEGVRWTYGKVPNLGPREEGNGRGNTQFVYARTLLGAVMEAAVQLETVVENLEQV